MRFFHPAITAILFIAVIFLTFKHFSFKRELVYVDSVDLINGYQGMLDARVVYQSKASTWKANVDTLVVEVQNSIKAYEKESTKMTQKEKELSQELIRTKQQQLGDYQRAMQEKAQQEDATMTKGVMDEVNAYLKKYGEEHNYEIILAANQSGNIAYAQEELNITKVVLKGLNDQYAGK